MKKYDKIAWSIFGIALAAGVIVIGAYGGYKRFVASNQMRIQTWETVTSLPVFDQSGRGQLSAREGRALLMISLNLKTQHLLKKDADSASFNGMLEDFGILNGETDLLHPIAAKQLMLQPDADAQRQLIRDSIERMNPTPFTLGTLTGYTSSGPSWESSIPEFHEITLVWEVPKDWIESPDDLVVVYKEVAKIRLPTSTK